MSIRTTVTLDDDVAEQVKAESVADGVSIDDAVNELLRSALAASAPAVQPTFHVEAFHSGPPLLNPDCTAEVLEQLEGPFYR